MPALTSETRLIVLIIAGIAGLLLTLVTFALEPNLRYWVRRLILRPVGRTPAKKPPILWALFCLLAILTIGASAFAASAPAPSWPPTPSAPGAAVATQPDREPPFTEGTSPSEPTPSPVGPSPHPTAQPSSPQPNPTPTLSYIPVGFCDQSNPPCLYLPAPGESWQTVARNTAFNDACRWPEIANLNRHTDGSYRTIGSFLARAGIFVPIPDRSAEYVPMQRYNDGTQRLIPTCQLSNGAYDLPCTYTITEDDGASALNYLPLAFKFYRAYEKERMNLDIWIEEANIADGCRSSPPRLLPGITILIPTLP